MKTIITIDSRAAGSGKTTGRLSDGTIGFGIYPRIYKLRRADQKVLVVVPSHQLQTQYQTDNPTLAMTVIRSDASQENVSRRLLTALAERNPLIVITHEAFKRTQIEWSIKVDYHLVFDEAINPYDYFELNLKPREDWDIKLNLDQLFEVDPDVVNGWKAEKDAQQGIEITAVTAKFERWASIKKKATLERSLLDESNTWRQITNPNNRLWVNEENWKKITDNEIKKVYICADLDPSTFNGWITASISAAAFEFTFMCNWLIVNKFVCQIEDGCDFVPHAKVPQFHFPSNEGFRWTKYIRNENPKLFEEFTKYVEKELNGGACLTVANNDTELTLECIDRVTHNVHGLNNKKHHVDVMLGSALNPTGMFKDFLCSQYAYCDTMEERDYHITRSFTAYMFYQILMRSALRDYESNERVRVFLLDPVVARVLMDFFDISSVDVDDLAKTFELSIEKKEAPKTPAERVRGSRAKKAAVNPPKSVVRPKIEKTPEEKAAAKARKNEKDRIRQQENRAKKGVK